MPPYSFDIINSRNSIQRIMSCRQSARKVKLTSKFEEFSTSRLASIQRMTATAHQEPPVLAPEPVTPVPKVQIPVPKTEAPATVHKTQSQAHKVQASVPRSSTPSHKPPTPSLYSQVTPLPKLTANGKIRGRPRKCMIKAETVVKPISSTREELARLREENTNLKTQIEHVTTDYENLKRQSSYTGQTVPKVDYDDLKEKYLRDMNHAKRHQWCVACLNPSKYHCCWNTTYCSQKCQVSDWYARHFKECERRRAVRRQQLGQQQQLQQNVQ